MKDPDKALRCLQHIDPAGLTYPEWLNVGFALKHEGCTIADWEQWSRRDTARYKAGECERKWNGFKQSAGNAVTVASLVKLATEAGARSSEIQGDAGEGSDIGFDDALVMPTWATEKKADAPLVDKHYIDTSAEIPDPSKDWDKAPGKDLIRYLRLMFEPDERVGIVADYWMNEGKALPQKGFWDRTRDQLIAAIQKHKHDLGPVIGDTDPTVGAWIRINPLDGEGVSDANVTAFRHALIECDVVDLQEQYATVIAMKLPCTCIVHSGGKSIHALVKIDAPDYDTYKARVNFLFDIMKRQGLVIDSGNRNPSRLSRLPGVTRNGNAQYVIAEQTGFSSWQEWEDFTIETADDLPDPVQLPYDKDKLPPLDGELIEGVLRNEAKMMFTGPSKAGKTVGLNELACSFASGMPWFTNRVTEGPVFYINGEVKANEFSHRMNSTYRALGGDPKKYHNITVWNLNGRSIPLSKLAPKLIRRVKGRGYVAIIIDPIYKVQDGDENDAGDMGRFCNLLDTIKDQTGAAIIYAHHHSKGSQGQKKSADRGSGSGVLARDADAIVDMIELDIIPDCRKVLTNAMVCAALDRFADEQGLPTIDIHLHDKGGADAYFLELEKLHPSRQSEFQAVRAAETERATDASGWRVEYTLRSFKPHKPHRILFAFPIHQADTIGDVENILVDAVPAGEVPPWKKKAGSRPKSAKKAAKDEADAKAINDSFEAPEPETHQATADRVERTSAAEQINSLLTALSPAKRTRDEVKKLLTLKPSTMTMACNALEDFHYNAKTQKFTPKRG